MARDEEAGDKPPRYVATGGVVARDEKRSVDDITPIAQALRQAQDTSVTCAGS